MRISDFWGDDRTEREFEEGGLQCCTRALPMGHRCGYVALPKGHPMFGVQYDDIHRAMPNLMVDGGLTFSKGNSEMWIVGWDAAHAWHGKDVSIMDEPNRLIHERYGEMCGPEAYVVDADAAEEETRSLARQIAGAAE